MRQQVLDVTLTRNLRIRHCRTLRRLRYFELDVSEVTLTAGQRGAIIYTIIESCRRRGAGAGKLAS